jgi:hypothetical protein
VVLRPACRYWRTRLTPIPPGMKANTASGEAAARFKHSYKGEVVNEIYTPLGQLDFSAELAQIAAASPNPASESLPAW